MYRLPSERLPLDLDGPTVEVQRLASWMVYQQVFSLYAAYGAATTPGAEYEALSGLYARFLLEAQPTWDIADHTGPIPPTPAGMTRIPHDLALSFVTQWFETLTPKESAVDQIIPAGPVRNELNRRLRAARKAA